MYKLISVTTTENVCTITLNRPEKRNAFTPNMVAEIHYALQEANGDKSVWVIVFRASGPVFCAGMDLKIFADPSLETADPEFERTNKSLGEIIASVDKPTIAIVDAPVYAGGFLIVGECHFVLATDNATFSLPEVKRGLFPLQVMQTLSKIMLPRKVTEWCVLGKSYSCAEAFDGGLVTHQSTAEQLENDAEQLVASIKSGSPTAIGVGIKAQRDMQHVDADKLYDYLKTTLETLRSSPDAAEGLNAFNEKRSPVWSKV